jgi:phosphate transport system permease protein
VEKKMPETVPNQQESPRIPEKPAPTVSPEKTPARFLPSRKVLLIDRFMTHFIKIGGVLVIAAVTGIFFFILSQILPLFRGAKVAEGKVVQLPAGKYQILGIDEWSELPFVVDQDGNLLFVDLLKEGAVQKIEPKFDSLKTFTAFRYDPARQDLIYGSSDGNFSVVKVTYTPNFSGKSRSISTSVEASPMQTIGKAGYPIRQIDYGKTENEQLIGAIQEVDGKSEVDAVTVTIEESLVESESKPTFKNFDLTSRVQGHPSLVAVAFDGSGMVVATQEGKVYSFYKDGDQLNLIQTFSPFEDLDNHKISSMNYLLGNGSIVFTSAGGANRIFSLTSQTGGGSRLFLKTKNFKSLPAGAQTYSYSLRNRAFLVTSGNVASLRYGTSEAIRWQQTLDFTPVASVIGGKYNALALLDTASKLHLYSFEDPHPESGFKAMFRKVWYEGDPAPSNEWQSTGSTDEFEPKLSMIPLLIGTLKGTFYALIFALPISILAAAYTSQFLHPKFRTVIKPTMEIMASLPSVVLGFMAALFIAPILETQVPAILVLCILAPIVALSLGWFWSTLPIQYRIWIKPGYEWLIFIPVFLLTIFVSWKLGPVVENAFFGVKDPTSGKIVHDFRLWWPQATGLPYEQRNSLVVGFMMGFAVIPIIFTIAEDALSGVPAQLRSASLALGASRWQTTLRIIIPTASAGIFSAVMIGLGRAVGETMIVVMATGNTPITSFNIFSGMRTLSANIAVELPEAPVHSTLYRTLFLGAMMLFLMTFIVNTFAELLRQHLREKYKTV